MKEINANIVALSAKIQKLRELKAKCEAIDVTAVTVSGSGQSISNLTLIDQEYALIKVELTALIDNSIGFFHKCEKQHGGGR